MRKFRFCTVVSFFLFLILFSSIASSSTVETVPLVMKETQVPVHQSFKDGLAMYDDKIVWMDLQDNHNIFMYDLATSKETNLTNNPTTYGFGYGSGFCIYDDKIVWQDLYGETISVYNISTQMESKIADESGKRRPAIYGNNIVWEDDRNGKMNNEYGFIEGEDIYMYNVDTHQETQITNSGSATNPAIYGDRIVWSDNRRGNEGDIYLYDLSTSKETQITNTGKANYAKIYGDRIVWSDNRSGDSDIYMYDLSTKKESQITTDKSDQYCPAIYGNVIVWEDDRNGGWSSSDIYMYDLSTSKETLITPDNLCHNTPVIYGDKIAWVVKHYNNNSATADIYMTNIDSSLPAVSLSPTTENKSFEKHPSIKIPKLSTEIIAALITSSATFLGTVLAAVLTVILTVYFTRKRE